MLGMVDSGRAIEEFLFQMAASGRSRASVTAYARELEPLRAYLDNRSVAEVTSGDVSRFLMRPRVRTRRDGREKAPATLNRTRAVVRRFFRWCAATNRLPHDPAFLLRISPSAPPIRYMTRPEMREFLRTIRRSRHSLAPRDHVLFSTLAYTGLRLSEAARMRWSDVDFPHCRLSIPGAKGGRTGVRYVPGRLARILKVFRRRSTTTTGHDQAPVFRSRSGESMSPRSIQYRFAFWVAASRHDRRFSVHSLRHTFGTLLYRATGDLLLVNRALGHRDIRSTQRYAHVADRHLDEVLERVVESF